MATQGAGGPTVQNQGGPANPFTQQQGGGPAVDSVNNGLQLLTAKLASLAATVVATQVAMTSTSKTTTALAGQTASQLKKLTEASINSITSELAALEVASSQAASGIGSLSDAARKKMKEEWDAVDAIRQRRRADIEATAAADKNIRAKNAELVASGKSYASIKSTITSLETIQKTVTTKLKAVGDEIDKLGKEYKDQITKGDLTGATATAARIKDANKEYTKQTNVLGLVNDQYNTHNIALGKHSTVMGAVTTKLLGFGAALSVLDNLGKLYDEANEAKKTGNYGSSAEFLAGQGSALKMGVSSKAYNEMRAETRGSALTDKDGQVAFDNKLRESGAKMTEFAGNREEGMRLAAQTYASTASIGISAQVASGKMDALGDGFNKLSKITGKTVGEMAELTFAITKDVDHRAVMLGMNEGERANYLVKQQQDLTNLKIQGYSIEQAQELQKIAMQTRIQGIQERISKQAGAQQSGYVLASQFRGPQSDAIRASLAAEAKLNEEGRGELNEEQEVALEKRKKLQAAETLRLVAEAKKTQGLSEVGRGMAAKFEKEYTENTGVTRASSKMETPDTATIKAKSEEKAQGADPVTQEVDKFAGYANAVMGNTAMLVVLSVAMGALALTMRRLGGERFGGLGGLSEAKNVLFDKYGIDKNRASPPASSGKFAKIKGAVGGALGKLVGISPAVSASTFPTIDPTMLDASTSPPASSGKFAKIKGAVGTVAKGGLSLLKGGGLAGLAGLGVDMLGDSQREAGNAKTGAALSIGGSAAAMAGTGAMLGAMAGPLAPIMSPLLGVAGGLYGAYQGYEKSKPALDAQAKLSDKLDTKPELSSKVDSSRAAIEKKPQGPLTEVDRANTLAELKAAQAMEKPPTKPAQQSIDELQRQFYLKGIAFYDAVDPASDKDMKQKHLNLLRQTAMQGNLASSNFAQAPVTQGA